MKTHREIGTLLHHEGAINWLVFFNSTHLFSASDDRTISIWECGTWDCIHQLTGHKAPVTCFTVHPSGKLGLSVSLDRTLRTWNLMTGAISFTQKLGQVAQLVQWNLIGNQYAVAFEKTIAIYEAAGGSVVFTITVDKRISCILYLQDNVLAVGSDNPFVQLFSTEEGKCLCKLEGHGSRVKALAMAPGGLLLFSASSDGCVKCWRLAEDWSKVTCISTVETGARLMCLALVSPESLCGELETIPGEQGASEEHGVEEELGASKKKGVPGEQGCVAEQGALKRMEQLLGGRMKKQLKRKVARTSAPRLTISSLKKLRKRRRKLTVKPSED